MRTRGSIWAVAWLALVSALPAFAGNETTYELKIERQPLNTALQELAKQTGLQIIFFSKVAAGHDAPALNGKYTAGSALGLLLNGTDLTFHELNASTIEVEPKEPIRKASNTTSLTRVESPIRLAQASGSVPAAAAAT